MITQPDNETMACWELEFAWATWPWQVVWRIWSLGHAGRHTKGHYGANGYLSGVPPLLPAGM